MRLPPYDWLLRKETKRLKLVAAVIVWQDISRQLTLGSTQESLLRSEEPRYGTKEIDRSVTSFFVVLIENVCNRVEALENYVQR